MKKLLTLLLAALVLLSLPVRPLRADGEEPAATAAPAPEPTPVPEFKTKETAREKILPWELAG